jgi:protein SCO1
MLRRNLLGYSAAAATGIGGTLFAGWWQVDGPGAPNPIGQRPLPLTEMDFQLTDHDGRTVGPDTLIGKTSMVFFGFTYCPDVCPTTLSDISAWLDDLGDDATDINVVLITVDPDRDTVDALADYVGYFHPSVRGWTGENDQILSAANGFRVRYEKVPTDNDDYTMNHTAGVFLFDAAGNFSGTIDYHEPREFAVPKIRQALANPNEETT